ncbi:MAG: hypothetical protein FWB90_01615 [Fibromonadales bacterium]|nr:hypothetical protein [Fibromonadales bacterium]
MDLREKVSFLQRIAEYSIRFRLIEVLIALLLCVVALFNIEGVLASMVILSEHVKSLAENYKQFDFKENQIVLCAIATLFIFRCIFFGFKGALLWFFFLIFNGLLLLGVWEFKHATQVLLAGFFIIVVTLFFFIRSLVVKAILPLALLLYSGSAWILFLGASNLAWFGLVSVFCADTVHLVFCIKAQLRADEKHIKTLEGAIADGVRKVIPVSFLTIILLVATDCAFHFMGLPLFCATNLTSSIIIYVCYIFWMPFFTAALLSFCPLENTCEKIQKKSK